MITSVSPVSARRRAPKRRGGNFVLLSPPPPSPPPHPRVALHVICIETSRHGETVGSVQRPIAIRRRQERGGTLKKPSPEGREKEVHGIFGGIRRKTEERSARRELPPLLFYRAGLFAAKADDAGPLHR